MPVRIRWTSKDYFGILLMFLGICGFIQTLFILIAQFFLIVSSYFVVIIIPIGTTIVLTYGSIVIFESIIQVQKRKTLKSQFGKKGKEEILIKKILNFPITKPVIISISVFIVFFIIAYAITFTFLDPRITFSIAEVVGAIALLIIANGIERYYGKVRRY